MSSTSLKATNKKRKKAATEVMNNAAAKATWSALGLSSIPAARIKPGHGNGHKRRHENENHEKKKRYHLSTLLYIFIPDSVTTFPPFPRPLCGAPAYPERTGAALGSPKANA